MFRKVAKILGEILGVDDQDITPEMELSKLYGIEAIDMAKIVITCEQKFNVTIHDEVVGEFRQVKDLVQYLKNALSD